MALALRLEMQKEPVVPLRLACIPGDLISEEIQSKIMENWKVIKTEAAELGLLLLLVKHYEDKNIQMPNVSPIEVNKMKMEERGMKAEDLEAILGS